MKSRDKRITYVLIGMILALIIFFIFSLGVGSADIGAFDVFNHMGQIIMAIRLPRIIAAVALGGALSVSGFLLQIFFQNPIAGPYVLGISSSAKLFVALAMVFFLNRGAVFSSFFMVVAAFIGSLIAMAVVMALSQKVRNMSLLVVCGVMIGYICSAITEFVITFAEDSNIVTTKMEY